MRQSWRLLQLYVRTGRRFSLAKFFLIKQRSSYRNVKHFPSNIPHKTYWLMSLKKHLSGKLHEQMSVFWDSFDVVECAGNPAGIMLWAMPGCDYSISACFQETQLQHLIKKVKGYTWWWEPTLPVLSRYQTCHPSSMRDTFVPREPGETPFSFVYPRILYL